MRTTFDGQLKQMHDLLLEMAELCRDAIVASAEALEQEEELRHRDVEEREQRINALEREIESLAMRILLRQQPVAKDLRKVSAALKMISDLERIGDHAEDIAELLPYISQGVANKNIPIAEMANEAVAMVIDSICSFVQEDLQLARGVIRYDDKVDSLFSVIKEELIGEIRRNDIPAETALDVLMTAKYLERVADHAVNVAEWAEYSITGVHKNHE